MTSTNMHKFMNSRLLNYDMESKVHREQTKSGGKEKVLVAIVRKFGSSRWGL